MKRYGFGIIGCGLISDTHAAAIAELPNAGLVAVSSRSEKNRRRLMDKYACEGFGDYNELAQRRDVDVVCICTPSGAHLEPAVACAKAGKHVIVEKPLEVDLGRADALIRACDENGVRLCTIFPCRFAEGALALKKAVADGRFGRLTMGSAYNRWWRPQSYYEESSWRGTRALDGGGACMNQGIHAIDLLQWYLGPVAKISAFTGQLAHERIEVEDTAVAAVEFANGAMGAIECATSAWPGTSRRIDISGDRGTVVMADETFMKWEFAEERPEDKDIRERLAFGKGAPQLGASDPRVVDYETHREQIRDFLQAVETGGKPLVDGREGRKALQIVLEIYRSARDGRQVIFSQGQG